MDSYLFLAAIGPIQSFIASARRTSDLYFGSLLLSELSKAAAKSIADKYGLESLIFPAPFDQAELVPSSPLNVANKIIAVIDLPAQNREEGKHTSPGEFVHKAVIARLDQFKDEAYTGVRNKIYDHIADQQIEDLVEYFWATLPYQDEKQYVETRTKLEAVMAARKNTRDFSAVTWGSNRPKSSIDGQLESVIPESRYSKTQNAIEQKKKATSFYVDFRASTAEQLSGVDLLKRRGAIHKGYPSTSHMAALSFLERLNLVKNSKAVKDAWQDYINMVQPLAISPTLEQVSTFAPHPILDTYDGSMLFEERIVDVVDIDICDKNELQKAKETLRTFYQTVDKLLGKARPTPYYAILLADGDRMGTVIDHQDAIEKHRKLSQALEDFARGVDPIVKSHRGASVYAGGDDALALLPVHEVLPCAHELAESFKTKMQGFTDKDGKSPTLSVGVVIVHHLDALQDSLTLVRAAEQKAKAVPGKDALAVTVSKRGGVDYTVSGQWGILYDFLEQLMKRCVDDNIPDGTAYEWENLIQRLAFPGSVNDATRQKVLQADAVRILQRKLAPLSEDKKKAVMDLFGPKLGFTYVKQEQTWKVVLDAQQAGLVKLDELTNQLLLAQLLADAQRLVQPRPKQGAPL